MKKLFFGDYRVVVQPTFEIGVALAEHRRLHRSRLAWRQAELLECIDVSARRVADAHDRVGCGFNDTDFAMASPRGIEPRSSP
jgi:hypothetical protein